MPRYLTQVAYTSEAWAALAKNPENRLDRINELLGRIGGRLVDGYFHMGEYDVTAIFEAPDDASASAAIVATVAAGHLKATKSMRLYTQDEMLEILRQAGDLSYKAPGAGT